MEMNESTPKKLDLETLLAIQPKPIQLNEESEVVMPEECGDTLWDRVLAQYETEKSTKQ